MAQLLDFVQYFSKDFPSWTYGDKKVSHPIQKEQSNENISHCYIQEFWGVFSYFLNVLHLFLHFFMPTYTDTL